MSFFFLKRRSITLSTGWYEYGLALEVAKIGILEAQLFTRQASEDGKNSKEDWAMVLESWMGSRRVQEVAARFQGIPSWVLLELPIPQKAAMEILEAWFSPSVGGG